MVSKITAMALVAIIAVPILIGYGLNIETEVGIRYEPVADQQPMDVTQLLHTDKEDQYIEADFYSLNNKENFGYYDSGPISPNYTSSGYRATNTAYIYETYTQIPSYANLYEVTFYQFLAHYTNGTGGYVTAKFYSDEAGNTLIRTIDRVVAISYNGDKVYASYYVSAYSQSIAGGSVSSTVIKKVVFSQSDTIIGSSEAKYLPKNINPAGQAIYYDPALGYDLSNFSTFGRAEFTPPSPDAKSVLFTIDLDTVSASSTVLEIQYLKLIKSTTDGVVTWSVSHGILPSGGGVPSYTDPVPIYYDSGRSSNTYQVEVTNDNQYALYFVGDFPEKTGRSNYYWSWFSGNAADFTFRIIPLLSGDMLTIKMRVDSALVPAFEGLVMTDKTYVPSDFRENPITTVSNIVYYGDSITFGGHTYAVQDGNLIMGTHKVPLNGITFSSTPNENGQYDNNIGNTTVSTTATPSSIYFGGIWAANVATNTMYAAPYESTHWVPGGFAWNGMDDSFLLVGLLACVGTFIVLAMYGKKSGAKVGGLMLVCGGAALMFLVML